MTLAASGYIQMGGVTANRSVNIELGRSATASTSFTESAVRTLTGVASGPVTLPTNFWNKPSGVSYTFTTTTANASLDVTTLSGYIAGASSITITVNSGVYLYSTSVGNAGLTLTGGTSGDTITLVNNGYIMGMGGNAENLNNDGSILSAATAGGTALSLGFNTTVTNTSGYIGGGGGAGGNLIWGGGGAGGGSGGTYTGYVTGGAGGSPGSSGANGQTIVSGLEVQAAGGGGGRVFPGVGGAGGTIPDTEDAAGGFGGTGGGGGAALSFLLVKYYVIISYNGGGGGGWGASGGTGYQFQASSGFSGGTGGSGGNVGGDGDIQNTVTPFAGTAGGKAVALNSYAITWTGGSASSSRAYGAVS